MKTYISLRHIQEISEELRRYAETLTGMYEKISAAEEKIKNMSYMEETEQTLAQAKKSMEENIRDLTQMAEKLNEVIFRYQQTEEKITDRCNLDTVEYPETVFGISGIGNLEQYRLLMPF